MRWGRPGPVWDVVSVGPVGVLRGGLGECVVPGALQFGEVLAVVVVSVRDGDAVVVAEIVVVVVQGVLVCGAERVPERFQLDRVAR